MKAVTLLATLKKNGQSNTGVLVDFLTDYLAQNGIQNDVVRLAQHRIASGTYIDMGVDDDWPAIYEKLLRADIILFATPIWWNSHSSELQRVIERLDDVFTIVKSGKPSPLEGKLGGVIITGDIDGAETITGNICNFFISLGISVPAYCTLGVLWEGHAKDATKTRPELLDYYKSEYEQTAQSFAESLANFGKTNS